MVIPSAPNFFIFCGPSLSLALAKKLAPEALVFPPIRRGDLERLLQTYPSSRVLIIDGVFYQSESVSLVEIREALKQRWQLYGASSMGALRAVEAAPLGMKGMGTVFRWFRLFQVEDDDEVAQAVHPTTFEGESLAMVDVRAMMRQLSRSGLLTREQACLVIKKVKAHYFPQRTLARVEDYVAEMVGSTLDLSQLPRPKSEDAVRSIGWVREAML